MNAMDTATASATATTASPSRGRNIAYWVTTGLAAFALFAGGMQDVLLTEEMAGNMQRLGYPDYFTQILGSWKLAGVAALLAPGFTRIKEWAYAGFFFNLTGAFLSHQAVGDGLAESVPALFVLGFVVASYMLRPASRRLAGPAL